MSYLEMTLEVEEEVLRLDVAMGNPLAMQIGYPRQDLLEATFDFAR